MKKYIILSLTLFTSLTLLCADKDTTPKSIAELKETIENVSLVGSHKTPYFRFRYPIVLVQGMLQEIAKNNPEESAQAQEAIKILSTSMMPERPLHMGGEMMPLADFEQDIILFALYKVSPKK